MFPQNRIAKRERKVVDYDLTRRELEVYCSLLTVDDKQFHLLPIFSSSPLYPPLLPLLSSYPPPPPPPPPPPHLSQSLRAKAKVNDQKIQQAEESYTHAKQLYDEITDELYEELPTFYDRCVCVCVCVCVCTHRYIDNTYT